MKKTMYLLIFSVIIITFGCKTTQPTSFSGKKESRFQPYTSEIKEKYKITDEEEKRLQFYNSTDFSLSATIDSTSKDVGSKLKAQKTIINDEIVFASMKPCVLVKNTGSTFWVKFETGSYRDVPFERNSDGSYEMSQEKLKYAGRVYEVSNTGSLLLVDLEEIEKIVNNRREVPGLKIGESSTVIDTPSETEAAPAQSTAPAPQQQSQPQQKPKNKPF